MSNLPIFELFKLKLKCFFKPKLKWIFKLKQWFFKLKLKPRKFLLNCLPESSASVGGATTSPSARGSKPRSGDAPYSTSLSWPVGST